jgi:hypothetical protein
MTLFMEYRNLAGLGKVEDVDSSQSRRDGRREHQREQRRLAN